MSDRGSGILLHITSLPSPYGIGDLGPGAYRFANFLAETRQSYWQVLPLNPTDPGTGNSPYTSSSAFAGNPLLISPDLLCKDGLLDESDLRNSPEFLPQRADFDGVIDFKDKLFRIAYRNFTTNSEEFDSAYKQFCAINADWLDDYTFFKALKSHFQKQVWNKWPAQLRDRQPQALESWSEKLSEEIGYEKFLQFLFFRQWGYLKKYCNDRNIRIMGDLPYYVSYDSADVWMNPEIFKLNEKKQPSHVAGVPPDYFSATGQLWGNPVYRWDLMQQRKYVWWMRRMKHNFAHFDMVRIDHFRGFMAYWEVPATEKTAINGTWVKAPAEDFFTTLLRHFPDSTIIAEDLGVITPDVREIIQQFGFPGMRILLFAFDHSLPGNPYAPHNHVPNCLVYTGTHDNNTAKGWFLEEADEETTKRLFRYLGREFSENEVHWEFVRMAMMSVAKMVMLPMQDIIGLGSDAKMNRPGTANGNWIWRLEEKQITREIIDNLRQMTEIYGRT